MSKFPPVSPASAESLLWNQKFLYYSRMNLTGFVQTDKEKLYYMYVYERNDKKAYYNRVIFPYHVIYFTLKLKPVHIYATVLVNTSVLINFLKSNDRFIFTCYY